MGVHVTSAPEKMAGRERKDRFRIGWQAAALALASGLIFPVHAADFTISGHAETWQDDNLFRKPDPDRQSDRIYAASLGGMLRLNGKGMTGDIGGELNRSWFGRNDYLNNNGYIVTGSVTRPKGRLTFDLSASRQRRLSDFSEIFSSGKNMQTFTQADGQMRLALAGDFRAVIGGSLMRNENSSALAAGYNTSGAIAGLGYYPSTGNYITLLFQRSTSRGIGRQPVHIAGNEQIYRQDYAESRIGVAIHYQYSALLLLDGRIGHLSRDDKSIFNKNFSGLVGDVSVTWRPRRTIEFVARTGRQLQSDGYIYSDSIRQDFVTLLAGSAVTNCLQAELSGSYAREHFVYDVLAPQPVEPRTDRLWRLKGGLSYALSSRIALRLDGRREWRHSTENSYRYTATAAILGLKITLGQDKKMSR
ncbi:outer membrane beta-barrel protein [Sphingomonas crusticola]|uniref:outer membrane beta-barrel protein n=1 Tax=Sphingomonas crusticola TaxID=1697973 RepID=UPI0013C2D453|nr:outer membrane beta-barrel protein [Sphingomonas crusticola]